MSSGQLAACSNGTGGQTLHIFNNTSGTLSVQDSTSTTDSQGTTVGCDRLDVTNDNMYLAGVAISTSYQRVTLFELDGSGNFVGTADTYDGSNSSTRFENVAFSNGMRNVITSP